MLFNVKSLFRTLLISFELLYTNMYHIGSSDGTVTIHAQVRNLWANFCKFLAFFKIFLAGKRGNFFEGNADKKNIFIFSRIILAGKKGNKKRAMLLKEIFIYFLKFFWPGKKGNIKKK